MSIGKDGFTDCRFVCNPDNGMAWSCKEYCPDYVLLSTTLRTGPITTTNPHNFDTNESENLLCQVVVLSCFAVLVFTILLVGYCLNKRRISTWFSKCVGEELHDTKQNQTQDEEAQPRTSLQGPGEDEKALLSFENENRSRQDDVNGFDHCSLVRGKRPVVLPNSAGFDCRVVSSKETPSGQALTHANRTDQNRLQLFTDHGAEEETELKEIGEHADLAIGQNLSFASKIRAVEPSTQTATGAENLDHSYENTRNPDFDNADENSRETDASENNVLDISNATYEHNSNESAVSSNEDAADGNLSDDGDVDDDDGDDYDIGDGEDDDDYDDEEEEDDDDDENEEDEENRVRITEGDHLLDNVDNANHIPNKTRNTVSSKNGGILRVTTEINIREV